MISLNTMGHDPPDLVRDLLRPEAHGARAPAAVELRATHASWVFLAGGDVWKVKRPVDLGFLDFTRPEARRRFCEEEVRLNRRLAPDVYLGVEPVTQGASGHRLGGDGPAVDWAVHMRRLPDDASAAALVARGALRPEMLEALAARLAAFFAEAPAAPRYGSEAALRANVEENVAQTRPFVGDLLDAAGLDQLRSLQEGELAAGAARFAGRMAASRIRDGHGDLRLEHVYFLPDPLAIDCIEFNERFRCGDVAGEAAFLAMELELAGRPDLAAGFLARFAEAADDFDLYGVLDFYLCYRAWVRGKVAAIVAADAGADPVVRRRKREEARRDFALARSFAGRPVDAPFLVAVSGLIGSGKSTLAAALGRALAVPVIGSDRTRKALAGLAPTERGDGSLYTEARTDATYAELLRRAGVVTGAGRGAILDATFASARRRAEAREVARRGGVALVFVETRCSDRTVIRERLRRRRAGASESDATDELLDAFASRYEAAADDEPGLRVAVDTCGDAAASAAQALRALAGQGIAPPGPRDWHGPGIVPGT